VPGSKGGHLFHGDPVGTIFWGDLLCIFLDVTMFHIKMGRLVLMRLNNWNRFGLQVVSSTGHMYPRFFPPRGHQTLFYFW
jgi:hypothetical protein